MQELRGFDELRNDQVITRNRSTKIDTKAVSLCLSASYYALEIFVTGAGQGGMFQGKRPLRTASPSCGRVEEVELSVSV
jgi:hypothetical protein